MSISVNKGPRLNIRQAYASATERKSLQPDAEQQRVVARLGDLQREIEDAENANSGLLGKLGLGRARPARGIYLWGGVGRGKTFLMDLFFETLAIDRKRRIHFHRMMREVHDRLRKVAEVPDPLDRIAADIAAETRVLCFDEFFVSDIGDAMVLGRLLQRLFEHGLTLVATSNSPPGGLYPGGLQRERFLPAIDLLERHTEVVELDGGEDYRLRLLQQSSTYLSPADAAARRQLERFFAQICPGDSIQGLELDILGRTIPTVSCGKGVAWFDFRVLCDGPRSQNDYIEIARWYQTVLLSDVPIFDSGLEDQARRFVSLVDEFYDRRVNLIISADAGPTDLYRGQRLAFEFQRTASRLNEMQSTRYLHEAHLA